jgi:glycerol-3-phosphate acyltransferase PlsY
MTLLMGFVLYVLLLIGSIALGVWIGLWLTSRPDARHPGPSEGDGHE